jgi:hypothetical protein
MDANIITRLFNAFRSNESGRPLRELKVRCPKIYQVYRLWLDKGGSTWQDYVQDIPRTELISLEDINNVYRLVE